MGLEHHIQQRSSRCVTTTHSTVTRCVGSSIIFSWDVRGSRINYSGRFLDMQQSFVIFQYNLAAPKMTW